MNYQEVILRLSQFWSDQGCVLLQPYNSEVGAGTFNPATFLRVLGPEPWRAAYVEPSRRPKDGRYGKNPNRVQQFLQYQVVLKPEPPNVMELYIASLEHIGMDLSRHEIRFVEDDWESPTLGASGLGWEVWLDGMEITQFTYFQSVGGFELKPITAELTYGLLRICMYLQGVDHVMDLDWGGGLSWGDVNRQYEVDFSQFNFEAADTELHFELFGTFEKQAARLLEQGLVAPGYDYVIKCSHAFNVLEARGAISVSERTGYIARVRNLARSAAQAFIKQREELGFPLLEKGAENAQG
jgi:glycyl-tRNA synthetase alpha chain